MGSLAFFALEVVLALLLEGLVVVVARCHVD